MQHFKLIKPVAGSDKNSLTEVKSFTADASSDVGGDLSENIYAVLTIWAPHDDISQIKNHIFDVFSSTYYEDMGSESIELRYKRSIQAVNSGINELNHYYLKAETRFHIEGVLAVVGRDLIISSASGNDCKIYKKSANQINVIANNTKLSELQNIFTPIYGTKINNKNEIIMVSSRFSDSSPKSLLLDFLKSDKNNGFREFREKIHSLKNAHLGAIWISFEDDNSTLKNSEPTEVEYKHTDDKSVKSDNLLGNIKSLLSKTVEILKKTWGIIVLKALSPLIKILKSGWNLLWSKYINPNPIASLIVVGLILAAVMIVVIFDLWFNPQTQALNKTYQEVQQQLSKAQTEVSNGQKSAALQTLTDLNNKITALPGKDQLAINNIESKAKKPTLEDLKRSISLLIDQVQDITRINATQIYKNNSESAKYTTLTELGDALYSINQNNGEVISIDKNGQSKVVSLAKDLKDTTSLTSNTALNALYALSGSELYQIKPDGAVSKQSSQSDSWPSSVALASYLQNIYFLSPNDNQIYRFTKTSNGFGAKSPYIKRPSSDLLAGATSLSINGTVFVAKSNGSVLLFELGDQQDLKINNQPADMTDISSISYVDSASQLILLNNKKNAFILLQLKDGSADYIKEVIVNGTSPINSFVYDKNSESVFFTSNNTINKFGLK